MKIKSKRQSRSRRHKRIRAVVKGTAHRPRLCVFRSARHIYAQLIDDGKGIILLSSDDKKETKKEKKAAIAYKVGESLAKKALEKDIKQVVFDRGGYAYPGRVKALAEGARSGGLRF